MDAKWVHTLSHNLIWKHQSVSQYTDGVWGNEWLKPRFSPQWKHRASLIAVTIVTHGFGCRVAQTHSIGICSYLNNKWRSRAINHILFIYKNMDDRRTQPGKPNYFPIIFPKYSSQTMNQVDHKTFDVYWSLVKIVEDRATAMKLNLVFKTNEKPHWTTCHLAP